MYSVCFFQFVKQQVRDQVTGDYKEDFDAEGSEFIKKGALGRPQKPLSTEQMAEQNHHDGDTT